MHYRNTLLEYLKKKRNQKLDITPRVLAHWHRRINRDIFHGRLTKPVLTYGRSPSSYGACFGYYLEGRIHIDSRVKTRGQLIDTLTHEMIHQMQDERGECINHGRTFTLWASWCRVAGINV